MPSTILLVHAIHLLFLSSHLKKKLAATTGCLPCRYLSHFRSVHRGAYFAQLRTTAVRKLLPESWGFMCPVHTPDGSPCGLLTHLTAACRVVTRPPRARKVGSVPEDILKVSPVQKAMV